MEEKEGNEPQAGNKESNVEDSANDKIQSLTQKINSLSAMSIKSLIRDISILGYNAKSMLSFWQG